MKRAGKIAGSLIAAGAAFSLGYVAKAAKGMEGEKEGESTTAELNRLNVCYDILTKWMSNEREGLQIGDYLKNMGIHDVGIYGHGKIGILLYQTLRESEDVSVKYFSDIMTGKKFKGIDGVINIPPKDMKKIPVDAIIVTPCWETEPIVSGIEDILKKSSFDVKHILPLNKLLYDM